MLRAKFSRWCVKCIVGWFYKIIYLSVSVCLPNNLHNTLPLVSSHWDTPVGTYERRFSALINLHTISNLLPQHGSWAP